MSADQDDLDELKLIALMSGGEHGIGNRTWCRLCDKYREPGFVCSLECTEER